MTNEQEQGREAEPMVPPWTPEREQEVRRYWIGSQRSDQRDDVYVLIQALDSARAREAALREELEFAKRLLDERIESSTSNRDDYVRAHPGDRQIISQLYGHTEGLQEARYIFQPPLSAAAAPAEVGHEEVADG